MLDFWKGPRRHLLFTFLVQCSILFSVGIPYCRFYARLHSFTHFIYPYTISFSYRSLYSSESSEIRFICFVELMEQKYYNGMTLKVAIQRAVEPIRQNTEYQWSSLSNFILGATISTIREAYHLSRGGHLHSKDTWLGEGAERVGIGNPHSSFFRQVFQTMSACSSSMNFWVSLAPTGILLVELFTTLLGDLDTSDNGPG